MGDIAPSKMPKGKTVKRKDKPQDVTMYKRGGKVKKFGLGGFLDNVGSAVNNAVNTVGNIANDPAGALNTAANTAEYAIRNPGRTAKNAVNYFAENPARAIPIVASMMKKGGKVNAAGNYTKPSLRKKIVSQVKAAATQGTGAGEWSARKAQLVAKKYKAAGGGYKD